MTDLLAHDRQAETQTETQTGTATDPGADPAPGRAGWVRRLLASDLVDHLFAPHGIDRYLELVDPAWVVGGDRRRVPTGGGPTRPSGVVLPPPRVASATPTASAIPTATLTATPTATARATTTATRNGTVTFGCSGLATEAAGTLLETAEAAGVAPRSRCRRGICGTCTTTKSAGRVRNLLTDEVSGEAPAPIRLCVSVPEGDVTLDL